MVYVQQSVELQEFNKVLKKAVPSDFDGHTDFSLLSTEQKLLWLSYCALFTVEITQKQ